MSNSDTSGLIFGLIMLMMVASGLFARKLPLSQTVKFAGAWIGIFAFGIVLFSFRSEAGALWLRITSDINPSTASVQNGAVRINKSEDGHFYIDAELNGKPVNFLIDSGATSTSLSVDAARKAGIEVSTSGFPVAIETANGVTTAWRARVGKLRVGPIVREDMPVHVSESFGETNMLGMDFLSSIRAWRVEGGTMILNP